MQIKKKINQEPGGSQDGIYTMNKLSNCIINFWYDLIERVRKKGDDLINFGKLWFH